MLHGVGLLPKRQDGVQVDHPPVVHRDVPYDDGALGRRRVPLPARRRADGEAAAAAREERSPLALLPQAHHARLLVVARLCLY